MRYFPENMEKKRAQKEVNNRGNKLENQKIAQEIPKNLCKIYSNPCNKNAFVLCILFIPVLK